MGKASIEGYGLIKIGKFSAISWQTVFELGLDGGHSYKRVISYELTALDWKYPENFYEKTPYGVINIGSDVWIGRGCRFKSTTPDKSLNIGNGAVIAADSVVVKDVPPFAIVGGNPAKFIKWRFEPEIIEALERIAWWNWNLEKIYDNFHLFNDPEEFIRQFDSQR